MHSARERILIWQDRETEHVGEKDELRLGCVECAMPVRHPSGHVQKGGQNCRSGPPEKSQARTDSFETPTKQGGHDRDTAGRQRQRCSAYIWEPGSCGPPPLAPLGFPLGYTCWGNIPNSLEIPCSAGH